MSIQSYYYILWKPDMYNNNEKYGFGSNNFTQLISGNHNQTKFNMGLMNLVESRGYLMATAILSAISVIPYFIFIWTTMCTKSLFQPKNIFKSNFAFSAIIHLIGVVTHLIVLYERLENICPEMYLIWWSATGLTTAVLMIELDRFLAIRYPLTYTVNVTDERSLGACAVTQIGGLAVILAVRILSPESFACAPLNSGHQLVQRALFLFIVVIPYFICFILSFVCALYVVRVLLNQMRKDKRIYPQILARDASQQTLNFDMSKDENSKGKIYTIENSDRRNTQTYSDHGISALIAPQATIMAATLAAKREEDINSPRPHTSKSRTSEHSQVSTIAPLPVGGGGGYVLQVPGRVDRREPEHHNRVERTMSCPARLKITDEMVRDHPNLLNPERVFRQTSSFALNIQATSTRLSLEELKRDLKSSLKTLSMLFIYLLMSCPLYISAAIYNNCMADENCKEFGVYVILFYNVSVFGLIIYPFVWLALDKQFANCIKGQLKKIKALFMMW